MNKSFDDLPIEIIIGIIGDLSSYIVDYLSLRLVSSRWKYSIDCYFATIKHLVHRNGERRVRDLVTRDGLIVCIPTDRRDRVINFIDFFPNLKAVSVELSKYTKKDQDTLFTYLNTRPTITSLELVYDDRYTGLENDVKLENIRNFALNAEMILSKDAISRLFQPDHALTQLYVNTHVQDDLPFEDGNLILKRMPTLKRLSQQLQLCHDAWDIDNDTDLLIYTKQPGLSFENLESYSFHADYGRVDFLNYVDNFVACCPNLKSVDCWLSGGCEDELSRLNLRAYTNVENLAIQGFHSSWEYVSKVLEMFPMISNLKLQDVRGIGHNQISQTLLKLPNLSLLYLRRLDEFSKDCYRHQAIVQVDCEALKEEYSSKYGRNLQIVRRDGRFEFEEFPFRHGFNFMKNIFWPDWAPRLLTD